MKNKSTLQNMNQMLTRNSYRQPTLTQMEFVQPRPPPKPRPIPSGWQRTVDQTTGDAFYVNATSSQAVYKYDDLFRMLKKSPKHSFAVTLTDCSVKSGNENIIPKVAVSSLVYSTPPRMSSLSKYMDGTMANPLIWTMMRSVWAVRPYLTSRTCSCPEKKEKKSVYSFVDTRCRHWREVLYEETDDDESINVLSPNLLAD
jgi:hypothetical protein